MNTDSKYVGLALAVACSAAACGDDAGVGTLEVTAYGEAFIEEGIPASAFDDGWSLTFEQFDVSIDRVTVGNQVLATPQVVDLRSRARRAQR